MPLPENWVERIFARMSVRYGTEWTMKWTGVDVALVKADWAMELEGFGGEDIAYALGFLPADKAPTVAQFRDICRRAPRREPEPAPALEGPPSDPARVAEVIATATQAVRGHPRNPRAWAWHLRDREKNHGGILVNGSRMTNAQRTMWRAAIEAPERIDAATDIVRTAALKAEQNAAVERYAREHGIAIPSTEAAE